MNKKLKALICTGMVLSAVSVPMAAYASSYHSDTDTNADALDYIENNRRAGRDNILTDEQKQLVQDALEMRRNLRDPLDPAKNVPVAVEGDDLVYDQRTGDFSATGKVKITSLDAQRFVSDEANGNLNSNEINVPGKAHMLQMTPLK